jgi:hypothetical protein
LAQSSLTAREGSIAQGRVSVLPKAGWNTLDDGLGLVW